MDENNLVPMFGAIPSEPDYRDTMVAGAVYAQLSDELAAGTLPQSFATDISALGEALDQNKTSACVSHAWALAMKYYWWKKTGVVVEFSPRFLHILSREDWIPVDGGRQPRTVAKISAKIGCCTTALLPNDTTLSHAAYGNPAVITQEMLDEAAKYKIPGYIRVPDNTVSDFRAAIKQFGMVSGLFAISDAFWTAEDGTITWSKNAIDPLRVKLPTSNHQMIVHEWLDMYNRVRNSWSRDWADDGNARYKAASWLPNIYEGWVIAEVPADLAAFMSKLPSPSDFHYQWNTNLTIGQFSDDVKMAQIALMVLGIMQPVPPDQLGYYGARTAKAVLQYQVSIKVPPALRNGNIIGVKTRAGLNAQFSL